MLAAPMPTISWSGSTSSPRRAAKAVAVAMVSVSDTSVMPTAAMSSGPDVLDARPGERRRRHTLGQGADRVARPPPARSSTADTTVAPTTATRTAGNRLVNRGSTSNTRQRRQAEDQRGRIGLVQASEERLHLVDERVGVGREAEQLRELPDDDRDAEAVHVPDLHLARRAGRRRTRACRAPNPISMSPTRMAIMPANTMALPGSPVTDQRRDGREDQGRDRRVGPEHEHPRRAEHRVADQAGDGRVEPGDRGKPGQLGVGHALGHEDGGQDDAGHEVGAQPRPLVGAQGANAGHPTLDHR